METKYCKVCGIQIPELRLKALPNTVTCVKHSTTKPLLGMNVQKGTGEDTWVETIIFSQENIDISCLENPDIQIEFGDEEQDE